jgi:hypothetical protein
MANQDHHKVVKLDWRPGKGGKVGLCGARINGDRAFYVANMDSSNPKQRDEFIDVCLKKKPDLNRSELEEAMDYIAAECLGDPDQAVIGEPEKFSQGKRVADLARGAELFKCNDVAYATITVGGGGAGGAGSSGAGDGDESHAHPETYPIYSDQFKRWLCAQYHHKHRMPATAAAIQDGVNALAGTAIFSPNEKKVAVRLAEHGGCVYLDMADDAWRCIRITPDGWGIITDPPVKFVRKRGMLPLPAPVREGGDVAALKPLLNWRDDKQWILMVSWVLGAFHPHGPYPILSVNGEHGSAKSTTSSMLRMLVDPNEAALRSPPRDERDLFIQAGNAWVLAFDNISSLPQWLSDGLCRVSTGGAFSTRMLNTDDTEVLFNIKRPIILNGIEEISDKHDLVSRSIPIKLAAIGNGKARRRSEREIWSEFHRVAPIVLGGLLDAIVAALKNQRDVEITDDSVRMPDFAAWIVAAEVGGKLPWPAGAFMEAYGTSRDDAARLALEESPIGPAVQLLMDHCAEGRWAGTISELLDRIESYADEHSKRRKDWPDSVPKLSAKLWRLAPVLRQQGIDVAAADRTNARRGVVLSKMMGVCGNRVTTVTASPEETPDMPF